MAVKEKVEPKHRILREVYRHYLEYRDLVTTPESNSNGSRKGAVGGMGGFNNCDGVIDYGYYVRDQETGELKKELITLSFWDLQNGLNELSPRKREAVFYNVILDKKQKDVAKIMGITTVSVGQYVEQAMIFLAKRYFAEEIE